MTVVEELDKTLEQSTDVAQRASSLAASVGARFPQASLAGCLLSAEAGSFAAVVDKSGRPVAGAADFLRTQGAAMAAGKPPAWDGFPGEGLHILGAEISFRGVHRGLILLGVPQEEPEIRQSLQDYAGLLGLRCAYEATSEEIAGLKARLPHERFLADIGQIARPVVHELYNLLNTLSLQVEVLKLKFPAESTKADLSVLKKQVVGMVDVLKWFRNYRNNFSPRLQTIEFNRLVRATVADLQQERRLPEAVELALCAGPVHVSGSEVDADRLLRFLLINADHARPVRLSTRTSDGRLVIALETMRETPHWELHQSLEAHHDSKEMCGPLELAAFKMLLERFRGKLAVEPLEHGVRIVIDMPMARS